MYVLSWQIIVFLEVGLNVDFMNVLIFVEMIVLIVLFGRDRNLREFGILGVLIV